MSSYFTAPDLSVSITDEEALQAFELYHHFDWELIETSLPNGATDTSGKPIDRHNRNLQMVVMGACAVDKRVGKWDAVDEALKLMNNPMFRLMVNSMIDAFEKKLGATK